MSIKIVYHACVFDWDKDCFVVANTYAESIEEAKDIFTSWYPHSAAKHGIDITSDVKVAKAWAAEENRVRHCENEDARRFEDMAYGRDD